MKKQKYAKIERERRFLVPEFPEILSDSANTTYIYDRYLTNSRLRLRSMRSADGKLNQFKFGQ